MVTVGLVQVIHVNLVEFGELSFLSKFCHLNQFKMICLIVFGSAGHFFKPVSARNNRLRLALIHMPNFT